MGLAVPASAATSPELPAASVQVPQPAAQAVDAFYASRGGKPLWLRSGAESNGARELIGILDRAPVDGMANGPALAAQAQALMSRAQTGDREALNAADRLLSAAWVSYVETLQRAPSGMNVCRSVGQAAPGKRNPDPETSGRCAVARSPRAVGLRGQSAVCAASRRCVGAEAQSSGGTIDPRVLTSLDRVPRTAVPAQICDGRYGRRPALHGRGRADRGIR